MRAGIGREGGGLGGQGKRGVGKGGGVGGVRREPKKRGGGGWGRGRAGRGAGRTGEKGGWAERKGGQGGGKVCVEGVTSCSSTNGLSKGENGDIDAAGNPVLAQHQT